MPTSYDRCLLQQSPAVRHSVYASQLKLLPNYGRYSIAWCTSLRRKSGGEVYASWDFAEAVICRVSGRAVFAAS